VYVRFPPLTERAVAATRRGVHFQQPRFPEPGYGPDFVLPNYNNPAYSRVYL